MSIIESLEDRCKHSTVFSAAGAYGYALTAAEELACGDGVMDFCFKDAEKARLAQLRVVFWSKYNCALLFTKSAQRR